MGVRGTRAAPWSDGRARGRGTRGGAGAKLLLGGGHSRGMRQGRSSPTGRPSRHRGAETLPTGVTAAGRGRSEGEPGLAEIASANDALGLRLDNRDSLPGPCPPPRGPGRGLGVPQPSKASVRDPHTRGSGANPALLRFPHQEK